MYRKCKVEGRQGILSPNVSVILQSLLEGIVELLLGSIVREVAIRDAVKEGKVGGYIFLSSSLSEIVRNELTDQWKRQPTYRSSSR